MEDYRNMERCSGEPCCIFAERICADNEKEILKMEKDTKEKVTADEMMDDLIYLAELIDFMGITSCLAVRGTLSERMTDKLTDYNFVRNCGGDSEWRISRIKAH